MGLTQTKSSASGAVSSTDKQICAQSNTSGAVVYTVPTGKKFVGFCSHERSNWSSGYYAEIISASGGTARHTGGFSNMGGGQYPMGDTPELTLLAGTSVKNQGGSNYTCVMGIESDA